MATKERILTVLRQHYPDLHDDLFTVAKTGRVMGSIGTDAYLDLDHPERQDELHRILEEGLTSLEYRSVGPIVTMTLEQAHMHEADSAEAA